jgi:hypothetical protein
MDRFREKRGRGVYRDALPSLLPTTTSNLSDGENSTSEVAVWLRTNGTAPLAAPKLSVPLVIITPVDAGEVADVKPAPQAEQAPIATEPPAVNAPVEIP